MAGPQLQQNLIPNDPTLSDLLNLLKKEIMLDLNCHHPATIQSFDAVAQTVTATINYTKTFFQLNSATRQYDPIQVNYPIIVDCPIIVMSGGDAHLTFPIAKGDECLMLFNDRDLENWLQSGQVGPVATSALHSFADAIALIGLNSSANLIQDYDAVRAVLRNGNAKVGVGTDKILIANTDSTLNTLLQNILTQLENLATAAAAITVTGVQGGGGTSGPPSNASTFTAVSSQLSSLATQLGGLLE